MDVTWFVPVVVLMVGAVGTLVLLRRLVIATEELAAARRRIGRLEQGLIPVRVETRRTRASIEQIHRR